LQAAASAWYGFFVPAKTEIITKMNADTIAALADPSVHGRLAPLGYDSDCDPLSYSMGYREGLSSRAGTRRKAPRLRYPHLSIEVRRPHSS
jgi:hypothetical protein